MSETTERQARTTTRERQPAAVTIDESMLQRVIEATIDARASRPSPVGLETFEQIEAFAERVTKSSLCPNAYQRKPDDAIVAVMMGKELGIPPMASLQSICVVNGRPSLYGEIIPGICMATGKVEDVVERWEGEEGSDNFAAVCIVTRRGMSPREGRFSYGDVRRAGLKNVHMQYPKDMIMWRARHRAWHGAFPDALKGLGTAELEIEEAQRPAWPMPRPQASWVQQKADAWTSPWFATFREALLNEPNAWRWLDLLTTGLAQAPSLRDVEEVEGLQVVVDTMANAPADAKTIIAAAFDAARSRLAATAQDKPTQPAAPKPIEQAAHAAAQAPAKAAAPPPESGSAPNPAPGGVAFAHWLLDETGEPVEEFTDPHAFADALRALFQRSANKEALLNENADAIEDAAKDPRAKAIIDEISEPEEPAEQSSDWTPMHIVLPMERGTEDWKTYIHDFKDAIQHIDATQYLDWLATQHHTFNGAPASTRLLIVKACVTRAKEIGIEPPALLQQEAPKQEPAPPVQQQEQTAPANGAAETSVPADKDQKTVAGLLQSLASATTIQQIDAWTKSVTTSAVRMRLQNEEKLHLVKQLVHGEAQKRAELRAGA